MRKGLPSDMAKPRQQDGKAVTARLKSIYRKAKKP